MEQNDLAFCKLSTKRKVPRILSEYYQHGKPHKLNIDDRNETNLFFV